MLLTKGEQDVAAEKLAFEVHHLQLFLRLCKLCHAEFVRRAGSYPRSCLDHAFEQAYYVHLRVIIMFFMEGRKDDINWRYFLSDGTDFQPEAFEPFVPNSKKPMVLRQLDKRMAHLTRERLDPPMRSDDSARDELQYYLNYGERVSTTLEKYMAALGDWPARAAYERKIEAFRARDRSILEVPAHLKRRAWHDV